MNLARAIEHLAAGARPIKDYILQDDGNGVYLAFWDTALGPQPTIAQLIEIDSALSPASPPVSQADLAAQVEALRAALAALMRQAGGG